MLVLSLERTVLHEARYLLDKVRSEQIVFLIVARLVFLILLQCIAEGVCLR